MKFDLSMKHSTVLILCFTVDVVYCFMNQSHACVLAQTCTDRQLDGHTKQNKSKSIFKS